MAYIYKTFRVSRKCTRCIADDFHTLSMLSRLRNHRTMKQALT